MATSIGTRQARENMADIIGEVHYGNQRYIIEQHGKPVVAVVSVDDLKLLEEIEDMIDSKLLKEAIESSEGTLPISELFAERGHFLQKKKE